MLLVEEVMAELSNRQKDIFLQALDLSSPEEREAYLAQACGSDTSLRRQVEAMLQAHGVPDSFLEKPAVDLCPTIHEQPRHPGERDGSEGPGMRVGPYKLLHQIGAGGMGVVYLAEQQEPMRRKVALKIIKPRLDTGQVLARFEAERQALAMMEHPNIAKVLDAGTIADGRPYFVMELVKGTPITSFCDANKLSARQRLELFIPVCQAIQHAHQKGVIHRDIKPSNVLIAWYDDKPVPKVIDFGVAKATGQKLTERTMFTEIGQVVGTLEYMSPEQATFNQLDIDTRSDVYSLGVLLYELLTGSTPVDKTRLQEAALLEVLRVVREEEPPRPSVKLSTTDTRASIAATRGTDSDRLAQLLRGELDWIVMKSLEKDRNRRYESAVSLARDVERYLQDELVEARPPSAGYRLRKFVNRHYSMVVAATTVVMALLVGIAGTIWGLVEADKKAREAVAQCKQATAERERAEMVTYASQLTLAQREWQDGDAGLARRHLESCQWNLRGWEHNYLHTQFTKNQRPLRERISLTGHTEIVLCVAYRPDGKRIVSGGEGHDDRAPTQLKVWDAETGAELRSLNGHAGGVHGVGYSPDGKHIVSGGGHFLAPGELKVWDADTGIEILALTGHTDSVTSVAYSPDGKHFVSASADGTLKVWDAGRGAEVRSLKGHGCFVSCVAYDPSGKCIVSGDVNGTLRIWNAATGAEVHSFIGHTNQVNCVSYSPDGKRIVSGTGDRGTPGPGMAGALTVWDAATGAEILSLKGHTLRVSGVAYSPDGKRIVSASWDQTFTVWDADTGTELLTFKAHANKISAVSFSPDSKQLVSASWDQTLKVWDWDKSADVFTLMGHRYPISSVAYRPDGKYIVSASAGKNLNTPGELKVWDAARGQEIMALHGHVGGVFGVAYSPDGKRIVCASQDNTLKVWDAETGVVIFSLKGHTGAPVTSVAYSPDGKRIVSALHAGELKIWNADTGTEVRTLNWRTRNVSSLSFSPDSKRIVGASEEGKVTVWNAVTGASMLSFPGYAAAFSPDGKRIVSASADQMLKVWNVDTGTEIQTLKGHTDRVTCATYSPDGKRIVSGSADQTLKVWNADTGTEIQTLKGHTNGVTCVTYSPDGTRIVSASHDGTVKVWLQ